MQFNTKNLITLILVAVGLLLEIKGVSLMSSSFGDRDVIVKGSIYMGAGLVIGLPAAVLNYYYRNRKTDLSTDQRQIEVEALANLGSQKNPTNKKS
ncbi:MAG TPA: hypothetical protein VHD84_03610 [Candidatus Saccharimonadales bacterium]|nr:hypothetical protein [Candidatus Saccharimonadales bacterium]